jgi:hypothetical protein
VLVVLRKARVYICRRDDMLMIDGHNSTASTHPRSLRASMSNWQICKQRRATTDNMLIFAHFNLFLNLLQNDSIRLGGAADLVKFVHIFTIILKEQLNI